VGTDNRELTIALPPRQRAYGSNSTRLIGSRWTRGIVLITG